MKRSSNFMIPIGIIFLILFFINCSNLPETIEKITNKIQDFEFPIYEFNDVTSGPWFQNFESFSNNDSYPSGTFCSAIILTNGLDETNDLDPTSDMVLKQTPSGTIGDSTQRAAQITPGTNLAIDATSYKYLIFDTYLSKPFANLTPGGQDNSGDDYKIYIFSDYGVSGIWTSDAECDAGAVKCEQWSRIYVNLDNDTFTGNSLDKYSINKITITEYDNYYILIDNVYFADNSYDPPPY